MLGEVESPRQASPDQSRDRRRCRRGSRCGGQTRSSPPPSSPCRTVPSCRQGWSTGSGRTPTAATDHCGRRRRTRRRPPPRCLRECGTKSMPNGPRSSAMFVRACHPDRASHRPPAAPRGRADKADVPRTPTAPVDRPVASSDSHDACRGSAPGRRDRDRAREGAHEPRVPFEADLVKRVWSIHALPAIITSTHGFLG